MIVTAISKSSNREIMQLAYLDLLTISKFEPKKRRFLFDPLVWKRISGKSLEMLEELRESLLYATEINYSQKSVFSSNFGEQNKINVVMEVKRNVSQAEQNLFKYSGVKYTQWLFRNIQLHIFVVESLSLLLHHSKEEDEMGTILNSDSIKKVLVCFAELYQQIEKYIKSIPPTKRPIIYQQPLSLSNVLNASISKIIVTFYLELKQFQFPSSVLKTIQSFADFSN